MTDELNMQSANMLDNIIAASASSDMQVTEDIYDAFGNKLLAKGYEVTPSIRDKVLNRVLKKPIETSIQSDNAVTSENIAQTAATLIEKDAFLATVFPDVATEAKALAKLTIEPLASMLLTVMRDGGANQFNHAVFVTLMARNIARSMQLSEQDVSHVSLAGLLHDVGDLYVAVPSEGEFSIDDWRKMMSHPVTGSSIVRLYMQYPPAVSEAIFEHHERCDGTGYPKNLDANNCSIIGQILIVAEAAVGLLKSRGSVQNMIIALKMSSGIYPSQPLRTLNTMLKSVTFKPEGFDKAYVKNRLNYKVSLLNKVHAEVVELSKNKALPPLIVEVAAHLGQRVKKIQQAIHASGLHYYVEDSGLLDAEEDPEALLELTITTSEIKWYIQDILRDLTFRLLEHRSALPERFAAVTEQLAQVVASRPNVVAQETSQAD